MNLQRKLTLITGTLISLLVALSAIVWVAMGQVARDASRINDENVPALLTIADMELNVKRLPENPIYPPIVLKDGQELTIWGVVTGLPNLRDVNYAMRSRVGQ